MFSKMKIVFVFEDFYFFHAPQDFEFRDLRVLKIDSLSSDTPSSPSSFMTCQSSQGSIAHVKFSTNGIYAAVQVPKLLSKSVSQGMKERKKKSSKTRTVFILRTQLSLFMRIISVYADNLCLQTSAPTGRLILLAISLDRHLHVFVLSSSWTRVSLDRHLHVYVSIIIILDTCGTFESCHQ